MSISHAALSTMATQGHCTNLGVIESAEALASFELPAPDFYLIGEGSNTLFIDEKSPCLIKVDIKGIEVEETEDAHLLTIGAGENWHNLVRYTVENNMPGLENLALIPGSVGAAPIQNIGAYGSELAMFCHAVHWFDFSSKRMSQLTNRQCQFGYRDSVFKGDLKNRGLITHVVLRLPKLWQPKLTYAGLDTLPQHCSARQIMDKVIEIRQSKLPDPKELANCGSFFKNPVVAKHVQAHLLNQFPKMPSYAVDDKHVKLAAGWLIEQAGLKGYRVGDVGVHQKQALVLVNYGNATGQEVLNLAQHIIKTVAAKFNVVLSPEVRLVSATGEVQMSMLNAYV